MALPALPILTNGLVATELKERRAKYRDGFLRQLRRSADRDPSRPALVFAPGFFTETPPSKAHGNGYAWDPGLLRVARRADLDAYVLHWPSEQLFSALAQHGSFELLMTKLPLLAAGALTPLGPVALGALGVLALRAASAWRRAVDRADEIADGWSAWAGRLDRPAILVGHSLGGRIALRAAQGAPARPRRYFAQAKWDGDRVGHGSRRGNCHST